MKKIVQTLLLQIIFIVLSINTVKAIGCGEWYSGGFEDVDEETLCQCDRNNNHLEKVGSVGLSYAYCCGFVENDQCLVLEKELSCGQTLGSADKSNPRGFTCNCEGGQLESYWINQWTSKRGLCCGFTNDDFTQCLTAPPGANDVYCGDVYDPNSDQQCICGGGSGRTPITEGENAGKTCCGWLRDGKCRNTDSAVNDIEVDQGTLDRLNPLKIASGDASLSTPGGIISKALKSFVFPIAGIILFVVLLLGGFQMLAGANNSKSLEEGKQKITSAIIGFILLFAAYWIAQLLEIIFGIRILS